MYENSRVKFEIGFDWVRFLQNWVCFGQIGFVFPASARLLVVIMLCFNGGYVHFNLFKIGFVLHN